MQFIKDGASDAGRVIVKYVILGSLALLIGGGGLYFAYQQLRAPYVAAKEKVIDAKNAVRDAGHATAERTRDVGHATIELSRDAGAAARDATVRAKDAVADRATATIEQARERAPEIVEKGKTLGSTAVEKTRAAGSGILDRYRTWREGDTVNNEPPK